MNTLNARKFVAIFAAVSLAFLQIVPAGVAATNSKNLISETGVPTSEKSATDTTTQQASASTAVPSTTTSFQMNTGGISAAVTPETVPATVENITTEDSSSEKLTNEQLQARIDQLLEEARLLEEQATKQTQEASALNARAAEVRRIAEQMIARAQEEARIAQALTQKGQTLLLAAEKEMAAITAREMAARTELALLQKNMKPANAVSLKIAVLKQELAFLAKQKIAVTRKIANAQAILQGAQERKQLATAARNEGKLQLQAAAELLKKSASLLEQARALRAEVAAKVALANELKTKLIPPAVEAFVDKLQAQLPGFMVTVVLRNNGTYLVHIRTMVAYDVCVGEGCLPNKGPFNFVEFSLTADGNLNLDSIKVDYLGFNNVHGRLLFAALEMNVCPAGMSCLAVMPSPIDTLKKMTQISVTKVENGAIFYTIGGKNFKAYRDANGQVNVEEILSIPPAVQAFMDQLKNEYHVKATLQADGTYLVHIVRVDTCLPGVLCTEPILSLKFNLTKTGDFNRDSIKANYNGIEVDGKLLYEAMNVCPAGMSCLAVMPSPIDTLKKMTQISVTKVENGAIFYTVGGKNFKAYRDANGQVKVEEILSIPPAVQAFVDKLQAQLPGFMVTVVLRNNGTYLVNIRTLVAYDACVGEGCLPNKGPFNFVEFSLTADGNLNPDSIKVDYLGFNNVHGRLLFAALEMNVCPAGMSCLAVMPSPIDTLKKMTQVSVTKVENGAIFYTVGGKNFKAYRDANGQVKVEEILSIPPAVQALADKLQAQLPGFKVSVVSLKDTTGLVRYQISVADSKSYVQAPTSGLRQMSMSVLADGTIVTKSLMAVYYSPNGSIKVDGSLLFAALELNVCPAGMSCLAVVPSQIDTLKKLATISVTKVELGAIFYTIGGKNYKVYRDTTGQVKVIEFGAIILQ